MTAATLTPDALVAWGREVLAKAEEGRCPDTAGREAAAALVRLRDAIGDWDEMNADPSYPAGELYLVAGHQDPRGEALRLAAEDVRELGEDLIFLFPAADVEPVP